MLFLIAMALFGASALQSNTSTLTEWVKNTSGSMWSAAAEPIVPFPDGRYAVSEVKEIRWDGKAKRPDGIVFVPTGMESKPKTEVQAAPAKKAPARPTGSIINLPNLTPVGTNISAKPAQQGVNDLGIVGKRNQFSNVNTDEILSYFQKTNITNEGNEETGVILNVNGSCGLHEAPPSSATFESK